MICYTIISFVNLAICTGSAILYSKLYLDINWWPITRKAKCSFYPCKPSRVNTSATTTVNGEKTCLSNDHSYNRCSYDLYKCINASTDTPRQCVIAQDNLATLFEICITVFACVAALFLTTSAIHFIRAAKRHRPQRGEKEEDNGMIPTITDRHIDKKCKLVLDFICGLLHACIILTSAVPITYAYATHEGSMFIKPLVLVNAGILTATLLIIVHYLLIPLTSGFSNKSGSGSNLFGNCICSCCGSLIGKLIGCILAISVVAALLYFAAKHLYTIL